MDAADLRNKSIEELNEELVALRREQFLDLVLGHVEFATDVGGGKLLPVREVRAGLQLGAAGQASRQQHEEHDYQRQ